jgi:YegS/Rv2252/BmrU family lipid kinase
VHIIVNPASGQDRPVLTILNDAFGNSGVDWEVMVTKEAGDGRRYAEAALAAGVDAVGVYGGDGTVSEVAAALAGTETPLAIFPGGTANVMSVELGVPSDPAEACALVSRSEGVIRTIDVGQVGDRIFLTRLGMGLEAQVVDKTPREQKDRMGWLAYALTTLRELADPPVSLYQLEIDGERVETEGLICTIANSGIVAPNTGIPGGATISFSSDVSVSDGLLDVLVIRKANLTSLLSVAASMVTNAPEPEPLLHWRAREVTVHAQPPQVVQCDGEMIGETPVTARVRPKALRLIVPAEARSPTATEESFQAADTAPNPPNQ